MKFCKAILLLLFVSTLSFSDPVFWFKSQHFTGGRGANCGPASIAMLIYYSTHINISVQRIRMEIGLTRYDGATAFDELEPTLDRHGAHYASISLDSQNDIDYFVEKGDFIVMVLVNLNLIPDKSNLGKGLGNHYFIISGVDGDNYIVQDPWSGPDLRFSKKVVWRSMITRRATIAFQIEPLPSFIPPKVKSPYLN